MAEALLKRDFTNVHRKTIIIMCTGVCAVNSKSKMNIIIRINACKKIFLLALVLVHSTMFFIIFGVSLAILVMVPVEVIFWDALGPVTLSRPTLVLLLTLGSDSQRKHILKLSA